MARAYGTTVERPKILKPEKGSALHSLGQLLHYIFSKIMGKKKSELGKHQEMETMDPSDLLSYLERVSTKIRVGFLELGGIAYEHQTKFGYSHWPHNCFQANRAPSSFTPNSSSTSLPLMSMAPSVESASITTPSSWLSSSASSSSPFCSLPS